MCTVSCPLLQDHRYIHPPPPHLDPSASANRSRQYGQALEFQRRTERRNRRLQVGWEFLQVEPGCGSMKNALCLSSITCIPSTNGCTVLLRVYLPPNASICCILFCQVHTTAFTAPLSRMTIAPSPLPFPLIVCAYSSANSLHQGPNSIPAFPHLRVSCCTHDMLHLYQFYTFLHSASCALKPLMWMLTCIIFAI